ncbi:MarR family winged helix-turn-helix transcriptional regulator [Actinomadura physcomitrii]|uniref:MarR family winged helix-turn-helix transcriptional regulator n=1 Tax=Actinomadura physcomitrii TaxID=2650748 RepID=UPI00136C01EB|nr:MarR family transcriptional regulator [Actinomadura physcomitrii]
MTPPGRIDVRACDPAPSEDDLALATDLRLAVDRLSRRLRQVGGHHIPPLQRATLTTLARHGPLRQGQLARAEGVALPTMSRTVDALIRQGFATREIEVDDARARRVSLTPEGKASLAAAAACDVEVLRERLARLAPCMRRAITAAVPALEAMATDDVTGH